MPEPDTLRQYDLVVPGAAERILCAFEAVTVDASRRDDKIVETATWIRRVGAGWAFALLFSCFVAAVVFFALGNAVAGAAFIGAPVLLGVVSMLTTFGGTRTQGKD